MRKLAKLNEPDVLHDNAPAWTKDILDALASGEEPTKTQKTRYNHRDIKNALLTETSEKCAYCESKITHVDHGDIEHIIPKSKVPEKAFEWENLTIACRICNQNKGDFYDDGDKHENLVDPYVDEPEAHFMFYREIVTPRPDSQRAFATEETIKLTRNALVEHRRERMEFIDGLVRAYCLAEEDYKQLLRNDIDKKCIGDNKEYSAIARVYIGHLEASGILGPR